MTKHLQLGMIFKSFQLTSSRRGWLWPHGWSPRKNHFNSHPHEEDDLFFFFLSPQIRIFQLTSSRRGWPFLVQCLINWFRYFNSHPHEEDDGKEYDWDWYVVYFNSHPHEEDDKANIVRWFSRTYFNSHPHEEDDMIPCVHFYLHHNFNSHPHEEDDGSLTSDASSLCAFQLTSSRRGWLCRGSAFCCKTYFNSHPHEEDDIG